MADQERIYLPDGPKTREENFEQHRRTMPQQRYVPTLEERLAFKECMRESIFYRSLPIGIPAVLGVHFAVQKGFLRGTGKKWRSAGHVLIAGIASWLFGMVSYSNKCQEKFLHMHNSPIGDMIRKRREMHYPQFDPFTMQGEKPQHVADDALSQDQDRDQNTAQYTFDGGALTDEQNLPTIKSTTYDELRRRNREQFNRPQSPIVRTPLSTPRPVIPAASTDEKKNAYGDAWDN